MKVTSKLGGTDFILVRHWFKWYLAYPPYTEWQRITPLQRKAVLLEAAKAEDDHER